MEAKISLRGGHNGCEDGSWRDPAWGGCWLDHLLYGETEGCYKPFGLLEVFVKPTHNVAEAFEAMVRFSRA